MYRRFPPYQGTLNGQNALFYCVDFSHDITANTSWQATVTDLNNTSDDSATRLGNSTIYSEIAWLLDQSEASSNQTTKAQLQWAVWSFSGGGNPYGTNGQLTTEATNEVTNGFTDSNWAILTPTGSYGREFFVNTPEPSSVLLLSMGLVGLAIARHRKCIASCR
jgi:Thioester domain/PEP-CTERM motif